jgi:hypothetical protein
MTNDQGREGSRSNDQGTCEHETAGCCTQWNIDLPKSGIYCRLCRTRPGYVRLWEAGHGPGQPVGDAPPRPERRPEEERATCEAACADCERLGEIDHEPFCGLDLPAVNREKLAGISDCAKGSLTNRYRKRLAHRGGECERWKEALGERKIEN